MTTRLQNGTVGCSCAARAYFVVTILCLTTERCISRNLVALWYKVYRCHTFLSVCCSLSTFQRRSQNCEKQLLASSCLCFCPSVWKHWAIAVRILLKIDILSIFLKSVEQIQVSLQSDKNIGYFTLKTSSDDLSLKSS